MSEKKIEISVEALRTRSLFVAVPMYGASCSGFFTKSLVDLAVACKHYGVQFNFFALFNESLVQRARNYLADEFMRSGCTHMMFIDSDIEFNPMDVIAMLALSEPGSDKHILCGPYPKKAISWEKIKRAVDKGLADQNPGVLELFAGDFVFNPVAAGTYQLDEPVEVLESGTGFMLIQRETLETWAAAYPEQSYKPDHARTKNFDGSRDIVAYFDTGIDPESKRYLSEDYYFCQKARSAGLKVWLCPWMKLNHIGTYKFVGDLSAIAGIGASATVNPDEIKAMKK